MNLATCRMSGHRVLSILAVLAALAALATPAGNSAAADSQLIRVRDSTGTEPHPKLGYRPQTGMFLLASPRLADPRFAHTVVLLLDYGETGALGLVINRPTEISLHDALAAPFPGSEALRLHYGGPVEPRRLVALHRSPGAVGDAQHVFGDVYASASIDNLHRMLERDGHADDVRTYAGYAGWSPGQLDAEIARGDWIVTPADAASIFDAPPEEVWNDLMRRNEGRWVRGRRAGLA